MKKIKYIRISKTEIEKVLLGIRILSESLEDLSVIIWQFNKLTPNERLEIIKEWSKREEKLGLTVETGNEDMYLTCTMIELNIMASKYNIDPATVCMCISKTCKIDEKILLK